MVFKMIKEIVKDDFLLSQKSSDVTTDDLFIAGDLLDTVKAHQEICVGMAANMIGYLKKMMVVWDEDHYLVLNNVKVMSYLGRVYETTEGCLSHQGVKPVKRYPGIKISYLDEKMKKRIRTFNGLTAQIIQHELDHFAGVLI